MKRNFLFPSTKRIGLILLMAVALVAGCSTLQPEVIDQVVTVARDEAQEAPSAPQATMAPMPTSLPGEPGQADDDLGSAPLPVAYRVNRMIIKNAELALLVADTDRAIDQVTQVATDSFGYILTIRTWYDNFKYATITLGVPVDEFENALRRLRALALKVLEESASGTDVTDQYVDLESQLRNLEATEARIRTFLDKAANVEEALKVNQQLADITAQIEQIKGQMNYLKDRAAYSTITVHLSPEVPTPTPTPTPTITPTPTPTPTPTSIAWRPGETFKGATNVLGNVLRVLGDFLIWLAVILGPFALALALLVWLGIRLRRLWRKPN